MGVSVERQPRRRDKMDIGYGLPPILGPIDAHKKSRASVDCLTAMQLCCSLSTSPLEEDAFLLGFGSE
jgi:hypothetical protein